MNEAPFTVSFVRAIKVCTTKADLHRVYEGAKDKIAALPEKEKIMLREAYGKQLAKAQP